MGKKYKKEIFLVIGFALAVMLINLPFAYTANYHRITGAPTGENGSIDLTSVKADGSKIYLDGEWQFYWNRFIETDREKALSPALLIRVPDAWSMYESGGKKLPAAGFGSYKLTVNGYDYDREVAIYIPDFGGAYRLYLDGQLAAESGTVSKVVNKIFTVPKSQIYPVTIGERAPHEIIIEVATGKFSGLYMTPVMGDYKQTMTEISNRNIIRFILFGIALFAFFDLLVMYVMVARRKLHSSWMPVMILFLLIRIMLTSEFFSIWQHSLFFSLSYESTNEMMYLATFTVKYLLIYLFQEQCGIQFARKEKMGFLIYYVCLYLLYLMIPDNFYNQYFSQLIPTLTFALDIYLFAKVYKGRNTMSKYGMLVCWSAVLIIAGLAIDSYYLGGKIYMDVSLMLLTTFTVFSLIMRWVYSMRMGDLYDDLTESSVMLDYAKNQIQYQKDYYEALSMQMNDIREMKHDARQFLGVMSRLAEEKKYKELKEFLSEYEEKTDTDELPVFCENVIANSMIGYYWLQAKKQNIQFVSRSKISRKTVMQDGDLCIVLGNGLENAIEACRKLNESEPRFVSIEATTINSQFLLKIRNSYNGELDIADGSIASTKGSISHGLGIHSMEKVVAAYEGFIKMEHDEKEFVFMASVPEK